VGVNKWMRTLQDWFYTHSFACDNALYKQVCGSSLGC
jgi:hypothetical protein